MRGLAFGLVLAMTTAGAAAQPSDPLAETRPISTIDFFGQRTLDVEVLRKALPIHEGDRVSQADSPRLKAEIKAALSAVPHLKTADASAVCCARDGGLNIFVGIVEDASPALRFRAAPVGDARLPDELLALDRTLEAVLMEAVSAGRAAEDDSQGHALLSEYPKGRVLQEQSLPLVARHLAVLRRVLRDSSDGGQRAIAAQFLGYAPDKQAVVDDLVRAADDPDPGVRNNAVRALLVFSNAKVKAPRVPYEPFVALLDSPNWSDLNKGSAALASLSMSRDEALLRLLRQRSLPALTAMARWRDRNHSYPAYVLLGRIAGLPDQAIGEAWDRGEAEPLIAAATGVRKSASRP